MKKYINTSNYYLTTITTKITNDQASLTSWTFDVADVTVDNVTLPLKGYYWVDVDFGDTSKREIFRIKERVWYTLHYDARISPSWAVEHPSWASVGLRDFSQLLNSLSTNTDNFWEVEQTGNLSVIVRGWTIYNTSNMNAETGKITLPPTTSLTFNPNTTTYIVLQYNEEFSAWRFEKAINLDLKEEWQYPIAKIVTWSAMIDADDWIIDLRSMIIGLGNMRAEVYDPEWKRKELYLMDNMEQSQDWKHMYVEDTDISKWNWYETGKQDTLVNWVNIKTVNNEPLLWAWNIVTQFKLQAGTFWEYVSQWEETYTLTHTPLNNNSEDGDYSFIVYNESWQQQREWEDYSYDSDTLKFTFYDFWDTKSYRIFVITPSWETIGWEYNQFVTQTEYNNLPESKASNNVVYHIYTVE